MKEILGFENKRKNNNDICPNCDRKFNLPIGSYESEGFLGLKTVRYDYYTCGNCGLQWRIKQSKI